MGSGMLRRHRASREAEPELVEPKGNGSTAEWAAWAAHLGIEVPDGTKRDEIKDLVAGFEPAEPNDEGVTAVLQVPPAGDSPSDPDAEADAKAAENTPPVE